MFLRFAVKDYVIYYISVHNRLIRAGEIWMAILHVRHSYHEDRRKVPLKNALKA